MKRCSGVLLPIFSLPSPYGIGTLGKAAYDWIDFLHEAGQQLWQVLPIGPTSFGDSPYQSFSAFAGNPYFIDLEQLCEDGLLQKEDCAPLADQADSAAIDYAKQYQYRYAILKKAYSRFDNPNEISRFRKAHNWVDDYALFMALKDSYNGLAWTQWPSAIRKRERHALEKARQELQSEVDFYVFLQLLFYTQWKKLAAYGGQFWSHDNIIGSYSIKGNTLTITDARIDGEDTDTLMYERLVQEDVRSEDINQDDYCEEAEYSEESQEDAWYLSFPAYASTEEVNAALHYGDSPLFILHDGYFYHLKSAEMSSRIHSNETPVVDALNLQQEELPVLNLAEGDQLVTFANDENAYSLVRTQVLGACIPIKWFSGSPEIMLTPIDQSNPDFDFFYFYDASSIHEINGQPLTPHIYDDYIYCTEDEQDRLRAEANAEFCELLDSLGLNYLTINYVWENFSTHEFAKQVLIGNYGDSITFGQYIQTRYIETQAYFSATLYEIDIDNAQALRVERTHNGYYVVDIPNDDEGLVSVQYYDKTSSSNKDLYYYPLVVSGNS